MVSHIFKKIISFFHFFLKSDPFSEKNCVSLQFLWRHCLYQDGSHRFNPPKFYNSTSGRNGKEI
ncbi:hypothetical protein DPV73_14395 [Leptospira mayottensis]|nr:hypothetical protein DPV73_14395 [Leptospira mayottensis]